MNNRVVILGAGESGVGAAVLAKVKGFDVFVSDKSPIKSHYKELLNEYKIDWEEEQHTTQKILNAGEIIKSPGIPDKAPIIKDVISLNIPILSEIEFAGRYTDAKMICITGSNGKTTTTLLTYHILKSAGLNVGLAGNVGKSLALQVATKEFDYYVLELSSFQLDNMYNFKANIAVLLNITPDHLDRYNYEMQNYVESKFRITQNQTEDDSFIFWNDDPIISDELKRHNIKAKLYPFSESIEDGVKAYLNNHDIIIKGLSEEIAISNDGIQLEGLHNLYNTMAASISANILKIRKEEIREALCGFKGVEHRLEKVCKVRGVTFINDSKATNVNSCWYALESMNTPTVLILGGIDKGNDYSEIEALVKQKVKTIVCMGLDNSKIHKFFDGKDIDIVDTASIKDATEIAFKKASPGDTVLLSPCCASFDLFNSYEHRGTQFKECVKGL